MSKKWLAELLALIISVSAITPLDAATLRPTPGKQIVQEVEEGYIKGKYSPFLTQLHTEYERAGKAGLLRGVYDNAKKKSKSSLTTDKAVTTERNQKLLKAIEENPTAEVAQKVDSVVFFSLSPEHKQVLSELSQMKDQMPHTSDGTLKNKLSALEVEYHIKSLLLDIVKTRSKEESPELSKKKIALSLDKLEKMHDIAKEKNDKIWIKKLQLAKEANRLEKAFQVDLENLYKLGEGKLDPENSVEEKVQQIMMDYLTSTQLPDEVAKR